MEDLAAFAVDQVALEGPRGCSVARLVALLEEHMPLTLPQATFEFLHPSVQRQLWAQLQKKTAELQFVRPVPVEQPSSGRAAKASQSAVELVPLQDKADLEDWEALDRQNVHIVANEKLRDAALGIFCEQLHTFRISDIQRTALEFLGGRRGKGALRTELTKQLRMEPAKFHYILNLLEARGLIAINPIQSSEDNANFTHGSTSALVHLRRFAPRLPAGQIFKEVVTEGKPRLIATADDFSQQLRQVCAKLMEAKDWTLLESDLKKELLYKDTEGHRQWRRVRHHLQSSGHMEVFQAVLKGEEGKRARSCARLLKPYQDIPLGKRGRRPAEPSEVEDSGAAPEEMVDLVAEQGFDWQIFQQVVAAGEQGVLKHKLCRQLGVSMKKMKKRLEEVQTRFGLVETDEQVGKQVVKKWWAPEAALQQNRPGMATLASSASQATPSLPGRTTDAAATASPLELQHADLEPARQTPEAQAPAAGEAPDTGVTEEVTTEQGSVRVEDVGQTIGSGREAKLSSIAQTRLERLLERVAADGFILRSDLHAFFQGMAQTAQGSADRRTVMRIVDHGIAIGRLRHICLHVPRPNGTEDAINVVLPAATTLQQNAALVAKICKAYRQKAKDRGQYARLTVPESGLTMLEHVTRLRPTKRSLSGRATDDEDDDEDAVGNTQSAMWENGFIQARMIRARLLHTFLCKLVGMVGDSGGLRNVSIERDGSAARAAAKSGAGKQATSGPSQGDTETALKTDAEALDEMAGDARGAFTFAALWSAMPLDVFAQCIGTANRNPKVRDLILEARPLGELSSSESRAIVDMTAKRRLGHLLDLMARMDLLQLLGRVMNNQSQRLLSSAWLVKANIGFEEPRDAADGMGEAAVRSFEFDLHSQEQLESYWSRIEYVCVSGPPGMRDCRPMSVVPEMLNAKSWNKDRLMPVRQWLLLKERITRNVEAFNWEACRAAAQEFGLEYEQVQRVALQVRAREARMRSRADPSYRLPRLKPYKPSATRAKQSQEERRRLASERHHERQLEWRHRLPSKSRAPTLQRPWDPADAEARKRPPSASDDEEERDLTGEDVDGTAVAIPRRLNRSRKLSKKFAWSPEEDRYLLHCYVRWHAVQGFKEKAFRSQDRPMKDVAFKERQASRRVIELEAYPLATALMAALRAAIEEVWRRAHDRGGGDRGLEERLAELRRRKEEERKAAKRSEKRQRLLDKAARAAGISRENGDDPDDGESAYGALVVPFPPVPPGQLFVIYDERDAAAQEAIRGLVEQILVVAPRRAAEGDSAPRHRVRKRARDNDDNPDVPSAKRPGGRTPARRTRLLAFETLEQQLQRLVSRRAQSRSWLLSAEEAAPTPAVSAAAELIKSLLSAEQEVPDAETALVRRFSSAQISAAFAHLRRRNFVYHGGSRRPFSLTEEFNAAIDMLGLPQDVFEEAKVTAQQVDASETGTLSVPRHQAEVAGGFVAETLSMMANGTLTMRAPLPQGAAGGDAALRPVRPVDWDITADVSQAPPQMPSSLNMSTQLPARPSASNRSPPENSWAALAAASSEAEAVNPGRGSLLEAAYRIVVEAGQDGPGLLELTGKLEAPGEEVEAIVELLLAQGLVVRVPGYADWVLVAAANAASFFTDAEGQYRGPFLAVGEVGGDPSALPQPVAGGGGAKRGQHLLAPWLNHKGGLNARLWAALATRLVSLVTNLPGIEEADVVAEMAALTPCSTKRLLDILLRQEVLLVQIISKAPPRPPAFLCAAPPAGKPAQEIRHFFLNPCHSFSKTLSVLPTE